MHIIFLLKNFILHEIATTLLDNTTPGHKGVGPCKDKAETQEHLLLNVIIPGNYG